MFLTPISLMKSSSGGAPSAPTIDSLTFTDNNDGTPASLALTYSGDVTGYRVYMATGGASISVSAAQLYAGSGGTDTTEFDDAAVGSNIDLTGFTSSSDGAVRIAAALIKSADGSGASNVEVVTTSGLDFTAPTFSSAEVGNINADTLEITASETLFGTVDYTDFTLTGNTITAASLSGGKIRLTLGTTATSGDDYTGDLSYDGTGSALTDADGNALATFTSQNVTNNVSGGASFSVTNTANPTLVNSGGGGGDITYASQDIGTASADREVYVAVGLRRASSPSLSGVTIGGSAATLVGSQAVGTQTIAAIYKRTVTTGTTADIVLQITGSSYTNAVVGIYDVKGRTSEANSQGTNTTTPVSADINTTTGGAVIAAVCNGTSSSGVITPTGFTADNTQAGDNGSDYITGSATGLTAETPRTMSASHSGSASGGMSMAVVAIA